MARFLQQKALTVSSESLPSIYDVCLAVGGFADTPKDCTDFCGGCCLMNHSSDAAVALTIHQLVKEAVVLAVGAHAWVGVIHIFCEIHLSFSLLVAFLLLAYSTFE